MKNKHLLFPLTGCLLLCSLLFSGCKDDYEDIYQGYGMIDFTSETNYQIRLDDKNILYPKVSNLQASKLKDSMRLFVEFSIIDFQDSTFDVKIHRAQEILTKPSLPYDTSILDSIGRDPIKISNHWMAYGFLNFEFTYTCGFPVPEVRHMVNLLHHPIKDNTLELEFRHNAFNDRNDQLAQGVVSFPIERLLQDSGKPLKIRIKYNDPSNSTRIIEFNYQ